jgi:hypothetical protein
MSEEETEELPVPKSSKGPKWLKILLGVFTLTMLGCIGVCCGGPFAVGFGMNAGEIELSDIDDDWTVGRQSEAGDAKSAAPLKKALENQCWPMKNGIRVLFNHLWYNAITDGYDGQLWLEAEGSYDSYGMYIWGNKVFLRDETSAGGYTNRVLVCELEYADWKKLTKK